MERPGDRAAERVFELAARYAELLAEAHDRDAGRIVGGEVLAGKAVGGHSADAQHLARLLDGEEVRRC